MEYWAGLELRYLEALRAIASERAFGKAAARLGYSQSAVSQQIAALERIIGEKVIVRPGGPGPVSLTEIGHLLHGHCEAIAAQIQAAHADVLALLEGRAGAVRVGTYQSVGSRILPTVIREAKAAAPDMEISLRESPNYRELLALVESGEVDVSFIVLPLEMDGPFQTRHLMDDPYIVIASPESPLAARQGVGVTLDDLTGLPLIDYAEAFDAVRVESLLEKHGLSANVVYRSDHNATVQGLVAAGLGVAIVPSLTVDPSSSDVCMIEITPEIPPKSIGIAWHRDRYRSTASERFVDVAAVVCAGASRTAQTTA